MHILEKVIGKNAFSLRSEGASMRPILYPGDVVFYRKTSFSRCKVNDIVLIKKKEDIFVHRIIYLTSTYCVTKGDNNSNSDGKILPREIVAKAVQAKRRGRIFNLEQIYLFQSTHYFNEIVKVQKRIEAEGAHIVFLKGLPLHLYIENTHPRRIYFDCDVLVDKKQSKDVEKILIKNGYKKRNSSFSRLQTKLQDREIENVYHKKIRGFMVTFDVHFEASFLIVHLGKLDCLYPQRLINKLTHGFLSTKKTVKIGRYSFPILQNEYLILYLALHFFHHNFSGAFRLEFLDKIIRKPHLVGVKWLDLTRTIIQFRLQNFAYPVFVMLRKYYQTPIPVHILQSIKPTNPLTLKLVNLSIATNIFNDESRVRAGIRRFKNLFYLSPEPLWRKIWVFINPQVLYTIFWILKKRLFSFFSNRK